MKSIPQYNEPIRLGDVVQLQGTVAIAFRVNDSGVACYDLGTPSRVHHIAGTTPRNLIVQRRGEDGLQDFLSKHKRLPENRNPIGATTQTNEPQENMKARVRSTTPSKAKTAKSRSKKSAAPKASEPVTPSEDSPKSAEQAEAEGKLFGHPVTIVARTVGKLGASLEALAKVVAAHNIKLRSPNTLVRNHKFGQQGKYSVVSLTKDQLAEFGL